MVPEIPTDIPRDPDVGSSENTLPDSRGAGTLHDHLGLHAITQATLTVLVQAVFYALIIVCILFLVSFIVECSGWLRESKRRHGERKGSIARSLRTSESKSRYPEDGQKRSKPTRGLKERRPRPEVKPVPKSQDQFGQFGIQPVVDDASSQPEDNVFDYGPVILCTPDPQPVPHPFKTPVLQPQTRIKAESTTPSLAGGSRWPSPESIIGCTPVTLQKSRQIVPGDWVLRIRPPQTILKGTSDETDLYDGPWGVLKVEEKHKVQHTPMVRKTPRKTDKPTNSSKTLAKIHIPADSLLQKLSQGWVELEQLVKVDTSLEQAVAEGSLPSFRGEDGEEYYQVKKVRGVKHEITKTLRTSRNSRANTITPGSTTTTLTTKKYLVHWAGYPSEDDTWELARKNQTGGVPVGYIREWKEREKAWKETKEAEFVRESLDRGFCLD